MTKLVGGTNAFVRRPFLYTGVLYGLLGALPGAGCCRWSRGGALAARWHDLARLLRQPFPACGPAGSGTCCSCSAAAPLLGWLGCLAAPPARHLARIEPRA